MACYVKIVLLSLAVLLLSLTAKQASAQTATDTTGLYRIETSDGNEYFGKIIIEDSTGIQLRTEKLGTIRIARPDIKTMITVNAKNLKNGTYWFDNPQSTRYLFSPNGYGLRAGEGYYQNIMVVVNQISVGITDNVSIGLGTVPLFLFGTSTPVWVLPKVSFPVVKDKFNVGAGALVGTVMGEESAGFGIVYGITTLGSRDKNISLGLGYGYAGGDWARTPTFTLSGMLRTGNRGYLLTENYLIGSADGSIGLITCGGRRIIKKVGLDFGLVLPTGSEIDTFIAIPFLGLTVPFGQKPTR
ncbi:hypothetical protein HUW51_06800 [Adhaeribacter swui]|uniref:Transporter n=1 Tax=Adhaeribacter swui TaxID=2086471 RepID=A0A7G7G5L6_9BACT|nr:hypothetical protein [Adhaeribacter swui]QNF32450.1 hypothetical protein HUW51_06800 [Adhaeribacter swui]